MRIALGLEYDGAAFCGWQTQPDRCSVQDALESALGQIATQPIDTTCAGRTDAGVHALSQIVHFDTEMARPHTAWTRGVNALLPESVSVLWARQVDMAFHARYSAISRRYVYYLLDRPQRPGLLNGRVGWFHFRLDIDRMSEAAAFLIGEHDFSAFRAAECQAKTAVRTLHFVAISRRENLVRLEFSANAFLHHMVRNIVGSLVYVGCGRQPAQWMRELLLSRDRNAAAPTFSPAGLYFAAVEYDRDWGLPPESGTTEFEEALFGAV
ncbi:MAG: tRNA pseudouridine(38-40) synthase TruA [Burkholderiales bacterium]